MRQGNRELRKQPPQNIMAQPAEQFPLLTKPGLD